MFPSRKFVAIKNSMSLTDRWISWIEFQNPFLYSSCMQCPFIEVGKVQKVWYDKGVYLRFIGMMLHLSYHLAAQNEIAYDETWPIKYLLKWIYLQEIIIIPLIVRRDCPTGAANVLNSNYFPTRDQMTTYFLKIEDTRR